MIACIIVTHWTGKKGLHMHNKMFNQCLMCVFKISIASPALAPHQLSTRRLSLDSQALTGSQGARWPSGLERWLGLATGRSRPDSNPTSQNFSLRNFGNSVYPALPVSFGGNTTNRRSLLSGGYARGTKSAPPVRTGMCNCCGLHKS